MYDSGWVPAASGALSATVGTDNASTFQLILAASGTAASTVGAVAVRGAEQVLPYFVNSGPTRKFTGYPKVSSALPVTSTITANTNQVYTFGGYSGSNWLGYPVGQVAVSGVAASGGFFRAIVEGK